MGYASLLFHFVCPKMKAPFQKGKLKPLKGKDRQVNEGEESDLAVSYWFCRNTVPERAVYTPVQALQMPLPLDCLEKI